MATHSLIAIAHADKMGRLYGSGSDKAHSKVKKKNLLSFALSLKTTNVNIMVEREEKLTN